MEHHDAIYTLELSIEDEDENPGEREIERAIYQAFPQLASLDSVYVERQPV